MAASERSGWRDQEISRRHRDWGFNCPATDLDFMLLEFNHGVPVALVDYKHHSKSDPFEGLHDGAVQAMSGLYDDQGNQLPFFVTRYWPGVWAMKVYPMNDAARAWLTPETWTSMSEKGWVRGLYKIRKIRLDIRDQKYIDRLNDDMPPEELAEGA